MPNHNGFFFTDLELALGCARYAWTHSVPETAAKFLIPEDKVLRNIEIFKACSGGCRTPPFQCHDCLVSENPDILKDKEWPTKTAS